MKTITLTLMLFSLLSCKNSIEKSAMNKSIDSLIVRKSADSMVHAIMTDVMWDTIGLNSSPLKIIYAKIVTKEYSTYKDISVSYKNIGKKKISAIRFKWYGINAFNEPADMGTFIDKGFGSGFDDDGLEPGESTSGIWSILSRDAKRVVLAWPYQIAFEDGTTWKTKYKQY